VSSAASIFSKSSAKDRIISMVTITLTEGALLIFFQSRVEKLLPWFGIESITLYLGSQSGAFFYQTTFLVVCLQDVSFFA